MTRIGSRGACAVALATTVAALVPAPVRSDDPVTSAVRFNREIVRIIARRCEPCHASNGLVMSLSRYQQARSWGRAIREELVEQRMPPTAVAPGYNRFKHDPSLTAREMATLLTWLDGGMPRGDDSDLPDPPAAAATETAPPGTVRIALPPQDVPAGEDLVVRRVHVDGGAAPRRVARVVLHPGERRVLRGALVFASGAAQQRARAVADEQWVAAWVPWQHAIAPPDGHAFELPAGRRLTVLLYYRGGDEPLVDRSTVELVPAAPDAKGRIEDLHVEAVPAPGRTGDQASRMRGELTLDAGRTIWALQPATDESVVSLEVRARRPDGSIQVLLWMPRMHAEWPQALVFEQPVTLPQGTVVTVAAETAPGSGATAAARVVLSALGSADTAAKTSARLWSDIVSASVPRATPLRP